MIEEEKLEEEVKAEIIVERVKSVEKVKKVKKNSNNSVFESSDGSSSSNYDGESKGMFQPEALPEQEELARQIAQAQMAVENTIANVFGELIGMDKPTL